jgi:N-acetylglucosamine-6-phosphate deacetylase
MQSISNHQPYAVAASHVFDGTAVHRDAAVVIAGERVAALMPREELPRDMVSEFFDGLWLAPGFIDLQVNGGGDVLFNELPTPEGIATIAAAHRKFGTTALLPTFMTDTVEKMRAALEAVRLARSVQPSVLGIHLEGPFLSPERPGVHAVDRIRAPTPTDIDIITADAPGVVLVTLAPERVPQGFIRHLVAKGVRVSLGHTMATYEQTRAALAEGLSGFTHLFNAMPQLASRAPGPIAAALETPGVWYSLIVDGIHVAPAMLRLTLRGAGRPVLITDAMPPVGGRRPTFKLYGDEIRTIDGRCMRKDGVLAGAALDMASAVRNCVQMLQVPLEQALAFASVNPAEFIGLGDRLGRIAAGFRADLVAFEPENIRVVRTWVAGRT